MPFLKQAGHAHGKHAEAARALDSVAWGRHASELWKRAVQKQHASSSPPILHTLQFPEAGAWRARCVVLHTGCSERADSERMA